MNNDFGVVEQFENEVASFFGSKYAVAVDSCTHGVELCLRYVGAGVIRVPKRTYLSIAFLAEKLNLVRIWGDEEWQDYYYLTPRVVDAAVLWEKNSYVQGSLMSISFQYQKHLSLGRGGMILTDDKGADIALKKMSYDGRLPGIQWRDQDITSIGYHYYMTPETARLGLAKLPDAIRTKPRRWVMTDWPDLTKMEIFNESVYNGD